MTIRFECEQCGSILKIKDDLAGKAGKCPKCKTAFTVPNLPDEPVDAHDDDPSGPTERNEHKPPPTQHDPDSGDFDVDAFLSSDDEPPKKPKVAKSKPLSADLDDNNYLTDEPIEKSKGKKSKDASDTPDDDEVFRIRRGAAETPSVKRTSPPGLDENSEARAAPSRRPPGTNSAGTAANFASDLLSKSGKKGKKTAWNEVEADKKNESDFDWDGFKTYLFKDIIPKVGGGIALICVLYFGAQHLMGSKSNLPELGRVTGKVTLGGAPITGATVWFHPMKPKVEESSAKSENTGVAKKKKSVSSSIGTTDDAGQYELNYLADVKGAAVGECRIEIDAPGRADVPAKYKGDKSKVTKQVKPGSQIIDFNLSE